jgi:hypothetical protein
MVEIGRRERPVKPWTFEGAELGLPVGFSIGDSVTAEFFFRGVDVVLETTGGVVEDLCT